MARTAEDFARLHNSCTREELFEAMAAAERSAEARANSLSALHGKMFELARLYRAELLQVLEEAVGRVVAPAEDVEKYLSLTADEVYRAHVHIAALDRLLLGEPRKVPPHRSADGTPNLRGGCT